MSGKNVKRRTRKKKTANAEYGQSDLEHLSDLEHVRERPSMYIGDTTGRGLHHLVYEVVDNSIDEAMAGYATEVRVMVNPDGSVTVEDDGRGIPVEKHEQLSEQMDRDVSTLEGVMTVLKFGGKFSKGAYQTSGGLHGVGVTVVNFLSEWCEVEVCREGHVYHQEYARGIPKGEVRRIGTSDRRGTKTTFKPDPQIFPVTKFSLRHARQAVARTRVSQSRREDHDHRLPAPANRKPFSTKTAFASSSPWLNRASEVGSPRGVCIVEGEAEGVTMEIAMQYSGEYTENVHSYVNNISTTEGGTHLSGFRTALTRYAQRLRQEAEPVQGLGPIGRRRSRRSHGGH